MRSSTRRALAGTRPAPRWKPAPISLALALILLVESAAAAQQSRQVRVTITEGTNMAAALSPDHRTVAIDLQGRIWTLPVTGGEATPLTDELGDARQPTWGPDGRRVAFQSYRDGNWHIWSVATTSGQLTQHTFGPYDDREPHWSSDGRHIVFSSDRSGNYDIWRLEVASGTLSQITTHQANDYCPAFSPDASSIAFVSERDSLPGIWIRDAEGAVRPAAYAQGSLAGPSWSPDGARLSFNAMTRRDSRLLIVDLAQAGGEAEAMSAADEDVFPFRATWASGRELVYTADGNIKRGRTDGIVAGVIPFSAEVRVTRDSYKRRRRDFDSTEPQPVRGIVAPAVSPQGDRVAFSALGDLWLMPIGGAPSRLTSDRHLDLHPMWSPDGRRLAFVSDRGGLTLDLWVRDLDTGEDRRLTHIRRGGAAFPVWSPDGDLIAFHMQLGLSSTINIVDVATGEVRQVGEVLFTPGRPSFSPDGTTLALAVLRPYSTRYREGRNVILLLSLDGRPDRHITALPHGTIDGRGLQGPVWSPDGTMMAYVAGGTVQVVSVARDGEVVGGPRQLATELADAITWTADSRFIVFQGATGLRRVSVDDGSLEVIPVDLTWTRRQPTGRVVVHAGRLFDGIRDSLRRDVDIVIDGHRITTIVPHADVWHSDSVLDASHLTVIPGLIESHAHLGYELGESLGRLWLAYGVTLVRDPAADQYAMRERREAVEAGVRSGPREVATGRMFAGTRIYYAGDLAITSDVQLGRMLEQSELLQLDFIKTYVRLSDGLQRRVVAFAHEHGMPVASHELYPASVFGTDHVEHIGGTSRLGYSPKVTRMNRSYQDVIALIGRSGMTLTPTVGLEGGFLLSAVRDSTVVEDPRMHTFFGTAFVEWLQGQVERASRNPRGLEASLAPLYATVRQVLRAGGTIMAGTDAPLVPYAASLHAELENYVQAGLSPFKALQTATVLPAAALGLSEQVGALAPGMLADLVVVDGNPLVDITATRRVHMVVKNGAVFTMEELLRGK